MSARCQLCFSDCLFKLSMRPPALALAGSECPHYQEAPQGAHGACPPDSEWASGCQSRRPSGTIRQGCRGHWHATSSDSSWVSVLTIWKGPAAVRSRSRCRLARLGRESGPFTRRSCTPMLHRQEPTRTCAMQCATAGAMRAPDIPQLRRWVCHEVAPALCLASRST